MILTTNLTTLMGSAIAASTVFSAHTITLDVPIGPRWHVIWLKAIAGTGKVMTDLIGEIRVKLNNKVQRVMTADELNKLNLLMGTEYVAINNQSATLAFELPIFFGEPWRKSIAAQQGTAWSTGGGSVSSFQIEIDIKAYASTAGVTTITAKGEYEESFYLPSGKEIAASDVPIGFITKWYNTQIPSPGGGTAFGDFMGLPKNEPIQQISFVDYTNFVAYEIRLNNAIFREDTKLGNEARLKRWGMLPNPTSTATPFNLAADVGLTRGMVDIVFDGDDLLTSLLPVVLNGRAINSLNVRLMTSTAAGTNIKCLYQTVGKPD